MANYGNGHIGLDPCDSRNYQKWEIIPGSGSFKIKSIDTQKCLGPSGNEYECDDSRVTWILNPSSGIQGGIIGVRKKRESLDSNTGNSLK